MWISTAPTRLRLSADSTVSSFSQGIRCPGITLIHWGAQSSQVYIIETNQVTCACLACYWCMHIYIYICVCVQINLFIGVFICLFQEMLLLHVAFVYTHFCWLHMCLSCAFAYAYIDIYMYICTNQQSEYIGKWICKQNNVCIHE